MVALGALEPEASNVQVRFEQSNVKAAVGGRAVP